MAAQLHHIISYLAIQEGNTQESHVLNKKLHPQIFDIVFIETLDYCEWGRTTILTSFCKN